MNLGSFIEPEQGISVLDAFNRNPIEGCRQYPCGGIKTSLTNTIICLPSRVGGIEHVSALVGEHHTDGLIEIRH